MVEASAIAKGSDNPFKICPTCSRVIERQLGRCPGCDHDFETGAAGAKPRERVVCDYCLMEIPEGATVCGHCGREQTAAFAMRVEAMAAAAEAEHQKNIAFGGKLLWTVLAGLALFFVVVFVLAAAR